VQVALEAAPLGVLRLDQPYPRRPKLLLCPLPLGDVPHVAAEHWRPVPAELGERRQSLLGAPRLDTAHERGLGRLLLPHRAELPAERGRDRLEQLRVRVRDRLGLDEDEGDLVLEREELLARSPHVV
jgi:hypothetical protein